MMSAKSVAAPSNTTHERFVSGGAVSVRGITKWFTRKKLQTQALAQLDLDIEPGEFVSVIGPSGCGKSTLLRIIGGLLSFDSGTVSVAGTTPAAARNSKLIGFAPQLPALLPWRTVRRNVQLLGEINSRRAAHPPLNERQTSELLAAVGLGDFLDRWPNELSGGMQQRTSLVRCFVLGAPVLLMDEPFSALDEITRDEMRYLLLDLWERTGSTVVFVTHSIPEAVLLSDRVLLMAPRPGRVVLDQRIDLPRPRRMEIEDDPRFHQLLSTVRAALREVSGR
jgi:NitT/TauT family transport system ATP-binding protein